ncbi:MAG: hypothetical protein WAN51_03840, partial [Alphaproteobacteria bacterium]
AASSKRSPVVPATRFALLLPAAQKTPALWVALWRVPAALRRSADAPALHGAPSGSPHQRRNAADSN